jgi:hypothetical protein
MRIVGLSALLLVGSFCYAEDGKREVKPEVTPEAPLHDKWGRIFVSPNQWIYAPGFSPAAYDEYLQKQNGIVTTRVSFHSETHVLR